MSGRKNDHTSTLSIMDFEGFIFDLDGVITNTAGVHAEAWKAMFDIFLEGRAGGDVFEPFTLEDYRKYVDGKPRYQGVKSFLASRGIEMDYGTPDDVPEAETVCGLGNRKNIYFQGVIRRRGVDVYASSVEMIESLRLHGCRIAVATSSKNCDMVLEAAGMKDLFEVKVDGVDIESLDLEGKPQPDMFLEAARRLGVKASRSVVFEDAIAGVEAGRKGGFGLVVGVNRAGQAGELREAGADLVVDDLSEIALETRIGQLRNALESFSELEKRMEGRRPAVFFDYDGTLTPIVSRPEDAVLAPETRNRLLNLAEACRVAIVSGRGLSDVENLVGIEEMYYAGSHGFEMAGPGGFRHEYEKAGAFLPVLDEAERSLGERLSHIEGVQIERKKFTIAIHYRNAGAGRAGEVGEAVDAVRGEHPELRRTEGKMVYELQPDLDWDKGKAVGLLMSELHLASPRVIPFYIGDDITDEDAFEALKTAGITIVVGAGERRTAAQYRLEDTVQVDEFVAMLQEWLQDENAWWHCYEGYEAETEGLREALCALGNGYFVTRGASSESRADDSHYPGTYLAGGYNRAVSRVGNRDVENEDLVNMPDWTVLKFRPAGGEWFHPAANEILFYLQELDIKRGVLHRTVHFRDGEGRETRVSERRMVCMHNMHLAAIEMIIVPVNWSGGLEVLSELDGMVTNSGVDRYRGLEGRHLKPVGSRELNEETILLEVTTRQSRLNVAQVARTRVFVGGKRPEVKRVTAQEPGVISQRLNLEVEQGTPVVLEKVMAMYTSRDLAISEWCMKAGEEAAAAGRFPGLLEPHALAWSHLWDRFGVEWHLRDGREQYHVRLILRLYQFHLLQTASMHSLDIDVGIPARGWHGEAYRGHIFWDELIIFPFLNYRTPQITRSLLMYRYRRLKEARMAARRVGYKGAMYPWQSGSDGREETQVLHLNPVSGRWLPDNSNLQRHINAAIAYNVWQYYLVTGDLEFMAWYGAEIILEIARFFSSVTSYDRGTGRYEIKGVMGPDEYHDAYPDAERPGLDNNAYTNIMAVYVMNRAQDLFEMLTPEQMRKLREKLGLEQSELERWSDISRGMKVVIHDGIISQFEGYEDLKELDWAGYRHKYGNIQRLDRILLAEGDSPNRYKISKQADVLMLFYLFSSEELGNMLRKLGYEFDPETIPRNIDYYLERTCNGSSLSWIIHSWVASRRDREQSWELFNTALLTDFVDVQGGTTPEGIHLGAMAGCVDLLQRGYTGLENRGGLLRLNPSFPEEIDGMRMNIRYQGQWLELDIRRDRVRVVAPHGGAAPIEMEVGGELLRLHDGQAAEVTLGISDTSGRSGRL